MRIKACLSSFFRTWLQNNAPWIITMIYGDFWIYRQKSVKSAKNPRLYSVYLDRFNSFIGIHAKFENTPVFPHGLFGIFISNSAKIGRDVIIYHHVTIGSNTLEGSSGYGAPVIEDGVLIGAGAKIIGNITVGKNSRIGAGCVVTKDIPPNSVVVMQPPRIIVRESLSNKFISNNGDLFK